jgi:outer membrane protein OmpA-like peptidoglycan-associated protein
MADSVAEPGPRARNGSSAAAAGGPADSFDELRALIVGPEQRELMALQAHLLDPAVQVRDVSRVLPDAIAMRATDPQLTRALAPSIEVALTASVQRDPRPLADALFPVMGPAIRKAIAHTLASMMETLNRTVEHSVSWRAAQWRWTALRTGRPFAEVVLLNTLQYRVEQVFLIHRETGLLLQHVSSDVRAGQDADQISAMLTAITDFVRDSFATPGGETLDALRVGDLAVSVDQGPHAILACVVRGSVPYEVRTLFQHALESVHLQLGAELEAFTGDSAAFERARPILDTCLVTQFRRPERAGSYRRWVVAAAVVLLVVGVWAVLTVRDRRRWAAYLDRLRAEPGIVVLASERRQGKYFVAGLRDPLARDPATLVATSGLGPESVESRWEPYQGLYPSFVIARARDLLRPPSTVALAYDNGVLTASGPAPARWIVDSERMAPAIAGVRRFEYAGTPPDVQLKSKLEGMALLFPKGQSRIAPGQADTIRSIDALLVALNETVRAGNRRAAVEVLGYTDSDGTDLENGPLSQARADAVLATLRTSALDALDFTAKGIGRAASVAAGMMAGTTEEEKRRNRRVSFHVILPAQAAPEGRRP